MIDPGIPYTQVVLERLRASMQTALSMEFIEQVSADAYLDHVLNRMILRLQADVLAHNVLNDERLVPVSATVRSGIAPRHVLVDLPRPWWDRLLGRPARSQWRPVVGEAVTSGDHETVTIRGSARVHARYFRTFPEATIRYPPGLGPVVLAIQTDVDEMFKPWDDPAW